MDLTRLAADAGQFINRAVQYTGETIGQAEKTELDNSLEELLARTESTKIWTDQIISQTEVLLQPNPADRLEDRLYERLDWSAPPRPRSQEVLGDAMTQAGLEIGPNTPYGAALVRCGEAQKQMGEAERKFVQSCNIHFLTPLRSFADGEYSAMQDERRALVNKRLDLDIAKTRLRKAHEADSEAKNLNSNPLVDDYIAHVSYMFSFLRVKWLKMWAQEISQAEMELRICQSLFDRQSEITRRVLKGISITHNQDQKENIFTAVTVDKGIHTKEFTQCADHMRSLTDFVDSQACFYAQCRQHSQEMQRELASIPAVLCSNNWQLTASNTTNHPSTSNDIANEPIGLHQVNPVPVVIHCLPHSNQDPVMTNPLAMPEKATFESTVTKQPPEQTSNSNNNNNASSMLDSSDESLATHGPLRLSAANANGGTDGHSQEQEVGILFSTTNHTPV